MAGRKISDTNANGDTTYYTYDSLDRLIKTTAPFDGTVTSEQKLFYDGNSNVIKKQTKRSENQYTTEEYTYNSMGNITGSIARDESGDMCVKYEYDAIGRLSAMTTGLSNLTDTAGGKTTSYTYTDRSRIEATTDPMGRSVRNVYDSYGNLTQKTDRNGTVTQYTYTPFGIASENAGNEKTYW